MVKVRRTAQEEEAEFAEKYGSDEEIMERSDAGEIPQGSAEDLAKHMLTKEIVISDQVAEFLQENGMSIDDFIATIMKEGNRSN